MINVKTGQFIIEIPKAGSRSLVEAAIQAYGKKAFKAHGHHTLPELIAKNETEVSTKHRPKPPFEVIAVVRDPQERLVSALNEYMRIKSASLSEAFHACIMQSHIIFKRQLEFLEGMAEHDACLYPLEGIIDAQARVAGKKLQMPLWRNRGVDRRKATAEQIKNHVMYNSALRVYNSDEVLYAMAQDWEAIKEREASEAHLPKLR